MKNIQAIMCAAILVVSPLQSASTPPKQPSTALRTIAFRRAIARMDVRQGSRMGVLALQCATALMLIKSLLGRQQKATISLDDAGIDASKMLTPALLHLIACLYPATLSTALPKAVPRTKTISESNAWLAKIQRASVLTDSGLAINTLLLCGIATRAVIDLIKQGQSKARQTLGDSYDYQQIPLLEPVYMADPVNVADEDGYYEALGPQPTCCICREEGTSDENPLCYCCSSHRHIAHSRCAQDWFTTLNGGSTCPGNASCHFALQNGPRTSFLSKWRALAQLHNFNKGLGSGLSIAAGLAFYSGLKAMQAYYSLRRPAPTFDSRGPARLDLKELLASLKARRISG